MCFVLLKSIHVLLYLKMHIPCLFNRWKHLYNIMVEGLNTMKPIVALVMVHKKYASISCEIISIPGPQNTQLYYYLLCCIDYFRLNESCCCCCLKFTSFVYWSITTDPSHHVVQVLLQSSRGGQTKHAHPGPCTDTGVPSHEHTNYNHGVQTPHQQIWNWDS